MYVHLSVCVFASLHFFPYLPLYCRTIACKPWSGYTTSPIWREEAIDLSSSQLNMLEHLSHGPTPKLQIGNCVCNAHFDESSKLVALMTNSRKRYSNCRYVMSEI